MNGAEHDHPLLSPIRVNSGPMRQVTTVSCMSAAHQHKHHLPEAKVIVSFSQHDPDHVSDFLLIYWFSFILEMGHVVNTMLICSESVRESNRVIYLICEVATQPLMRLRLCYHGIEENSLFC